MSQIGSIGSTSNPPSTTNAFQAMSSEDFIRVMFTELTNQDPLSPNDTQALLDQVSSIRAIESDINLAQRLEDIALQGEIASSSTLLGSFVQGMTPSGVPVVGFVDSISITRDGPVLNLSTGFSVALDQLIEVIDPALVREGTPAPDDPGDGSDPPVSGDDPPQPDPGPDPGPDSPPTPDPLP